MSCQPIVLHKNCSRSFDVASCIHRFLSG